MAAGSPDEVVRERVRELLSDGPQPLKLVLDELDRTGNLDPYRQQGVPDGELGEEVVEILALAPGVWVTGGDLVLGLEDQLVDGLVLTHRLTAEEIVEGCIGLVPDLVGLDGSGDSPLELAGRIEPGEDHSTLQGPDGWLGEFTPGDLVAFRRQGDTVTVDLVGDDALHGDDHEVGLLGAVIEDRIRPGSGEEAVPLVFDVLARDPVAFRRPVRPLGELLAAAGLSRRGFSFGRQNESWKAYHEWFRERLQASIQRRWGLDTCCRAEAKRVVDALRTFDPEGEPDFDVDRMAEALGHGAVAPAVVDLTLSDPHLVSGRRERFAAFTRRIVDAVPSRRAAPARLLGALGGEEEGSAEAEDLLEQAVRDDPDYGPAAAQLAEYAIVRGDLRRALTLLAHPDAHAKPGTVEALRDLLTELEAPERGVGRNDPCPCGSGRKFKACCQRNSRPPLGRRPRLIRYKILRNIRRSSSAELADVALAAIDPDSADPRAEGAVMAFDPFIEDLAIFERAGIDDFLAQWDELLPDNERELIEELTGLPLRAWQIEEVLPGTGLRLREASGPLVVDVADPDASSAFRAGDNLLARPVRVDGQHRFFGTTLGIRADELDQLVPLLEEAGDAEELAQWYGRNHRPTVD